MFNVSNHDEWMLFMIFAWNNPIVYITHSFNGALKAFLITSRWASCLGWMTISLIREEPQPCLIFLLRLLIPLPQNNFIKQLSTSHLFPLANISHKSADSSKQVVSTAMKYAYCIQVVSHSSYVWCRWCRLIWSLIGLDVFIFSQHKSAHVGLVFFFPDVGMCISICYYSPVRLH